MRSRSFPTGLMIGGGALSAVVIAATFAVPAASAADNPAQLVSTGPQLRAAVATANAQPGSDRIVLLANITFATGSGGTDADGPEAGDLDVVDVAGGLEIDGRGHRIDANAVDRVFDVAPGSSLTLRNVTLTGGSPASGTSGGAVRSAGTLVITDSIAAGNVVTGPGASGGALFNQGGTLQVAGSRLTDNSADRAGGAIEADAGTTTLDSSELYRNSAGTAPGNGGALHLTGTGSVEVSSSKIDGNTAVEGGGLWNSATGTMKVSGSFLRGNTASGVAADQGGGGLYNDGGTVDITRTVVRGNQATGTAGSGGGVLNNLGTVTVNQSSVRLNSAQRAGGGIEANLGTTHIVASTLAQNAAGPAPGNGGAVHLTGAGHVVVQESLVAKNTAASEGGGLWNSATGTFDVERTRVWNNTAAGAAADQGGGGIFNDGGVLTVDHSGVVGNTATGAAGSGGGILNNLGTLSVVSANVRANSAVRAGGGIETNVGTVQLSAVALSANSTAAAPGNGGGLHTTGAGSVRYDGGSVTGNTAAAQGGGLWNSSTGTLVVTGVRISGNVAPVGANVYNQPPGGTFTIDGTPVPPTT